MAPVDYLCIVFGGTNKVAEALGISHVAVSQWKIRGKVPERHLIRIVDLAKQRGLDLTLSDLINGRELV